MSESVICFLCMSHECRRISPLYCSSVLSYCSITIPMWIFLITIFFYELQILKYLLCRLIICLSLKNQIICHFMNPTLPHATQRLMMAVRKAPQECAPGEKQFQFYSYAISIKSPLSIYDLLSKRLTVRPNHTLTDWLTGWLTDWHWLTDDWHWLTEVIDLLTEQITHWLTYRRTDWQINKWI